MRTHWWLSSRCVALRHSKGEPSSRMPASSATCLSIEEKKHARYVPPLLCQLVEESIDTYGMAAARTLSQKISHYDAKVGAACGLGSRAIDGGAAWLPPVGEGRLNVKGPGSHAHPCDRLRHISSGDPSVNADPLTAWPCPPHCRCSYLPLPRSTLFARVSQPCMPWSGARRPRSRSST